MTCRRAMITYVAMAIAISCCGGHAHGLTYSLSSTVTQSLDRCSLGVQDGDSIALAIDIDESTPDAFPGPDAGQFLGAVQGVNYDINGGAITGTIVPDGSLNEVSAFRSVPTVPAEAVFVSARNLPQGDLALFALFHTPPPELVPDPDDITALGAMFDLAVLDDTSDIFFTLGCGAEVTEFGLVVPEPTSWLLLLIACLACRHRVIRTVFRS